MTNPANALVKMLAAFIDERRTNSSSRVLRQCTALSQRERELFASAAVFRQAIQEELGVNGTDGEKGFSTLERRWARPTFDINGMWSGYQGEGAKTVLPAKAGAKFSFRLVPNQKVAEVQTNLEKMLRDLCPPGIEMEVQALHGAPGFVLSLDSPFMEAAARAIERGFGKKPVFVRSRWEYLQW